MPRSRRSLPNGLCKRRVAGRGPGRVCATSKAAPSADLARDERELADLRRKLDSKPTDCATTMRSAVGRRLLTRVLILGF